MEFGLGILVIAFLVTFASVKALCPIAYYVDLLDKPGGRKKHEGCVPLIGGIAIFSGVFLSSYIFLDQQLFIRFFMVGGGLMVFMGMLDDRYDLSSRFRLVGQLLIACIFVYGLDCRILSFGNLLGFGEIKLGMLSAPLTVLSIVGAVNAFNMLDGMDGLVGSLSFVAFASLTVLFFIAGDDNTAMLCMSFLGSLAAFLLYNLWGRPSFKLEKVFMGDAGSMFVGLTIAVLLVFGSQTGSPAFSPVSALWIVLLPMTDMFTLMYRRVKRGKSPMAPDRTHVHHILLRAGFSSRQSLFVLVVVQCILAGAGVGFELLNSPEAFSLSMALLFILGYQVLLRFSWRFIRFSKRQLFASAAKGCASVGH